MAPSAYASIKGVDFVLLGPDEIRRMSVAEVNESKLYVKNIAKQNGPNDSRLGPTDNRVSCSICGHGVKVCGGHTGHIELVMPVYHVYYFDHIWKLLHSVCYFCSASLCPPTYTVEDADGNRKILRDVRVVETLRCTQGNRRFTAMTKLAKGKKVCRLCSSPIATFTKKDLTIYRSWDDKVEFLDDIQREIATAPFTPRTVHSILRNMSSETCDQFGIDAALVRPENMLISTLLVPPNAIRPSIKHTSGSRAKGQDDLTRQLQDIVKRNQDLRGLGDDWTEEKHLPVWERVQYYVATYMHNDVRGMPPATQRSGAPIRDLTKRIKGKKGRVRGNLMGKRVNNSARTVITGDGIIDPSEIGIPIQVAMKLLVSERVTTFNLSDMLRRVARGCGHLHGAVMLVSPEGVEYDLTHAKKPPTVSPGWIVKRPLRDGDDVGVNRHPSLHKKSMMGHKVKVMGTSCTFKLNLSCTSVYNADFDGDEMNVHVPASQDAAVELRELMSVTQQILNAANNRPAMGLVQDALVGSYLLTSRDTFLTKARMMNLMMWMKYTKKDLPPPAIMKPKELWTGKQLFSMLIPEITISKCVRNLSGDAPMDPQERAIQIICGEIMCGRLCKATLGTSSGGIIHAIANDVGFQEAEYFIGDSQRVVNQWLTEYGFSVGIGDCLIDKRVEKKIDDIIERAERQVDAVNNRLKESKRDYDSAEGPVTNLLGKVLDLSGRAGQVSLSPNNGIVSMMHAGSKGNAVNLSQITASVGQQSLEGSRVSMDINKRTLSQFPPDCNTACSRGFVSPSYTQGLSAVNFYFHSMSGREGLVDTAVKTAATGYIQRRLMKACESLVVHYDCTVRNAEKYVVEFHYGGDGGDGERMEKVNLHFLDWSEDRVRQHFRYDLFPGDVKELLEIQSQLRSEKLSLLTPVLDTTILAAVNVDRVLASVLARARHRRSVISLEAWRAGIRELVEYTQADSNFRGYILSALAPAELITRHGISPKAFGNLCSIIKDRHQRSRVSPGEMVGALAAQSTAEPATQMTLNTFHSAGRETQTVTRGVPRLVELIDVSKTMDSPTMTIYLDRMIATNEQATHRLRRTLPFCRLEHLVDTGTLMWDPDPAVTVSTNVEEQEIVRLGNVFRINNAAQSLSRWVIRLEFNKASVIDRQLSITDIAARVRAWFPKEKNAWVDSSEHNMELWVIRVRLGFIEDISSRVCRPDDASRILNQDYMARLLSHVQLGGIPGIEATSARFVSVSAFENGSNGAHTTKRELVIETDGSALQSVWAVEGVDWKRTITNNVIEVMEVLGIEAAVYVLAHEIKNVFGFDGTYIDNRHIMLIVDTMALRGYLMPIRRHGLKHIDTGVLMKASFEESMEIIRDAALHAEGDPLLGVSENIMVGQLIPGGTGFAHTVVKEDYKELCAALELKKTKPKPRIVQTFIFDYKNKLEVPPYAEDGRFQSPSGQTLPTPHVASSSNYSKLADFEHSSFRPSSPVLGLARSSGFVPSSPDLGPMQPRVDETRKARLEEIWRQSREASRHQNNHHHSHHHGNIRKRKRPTERKSSVPKSPIYVPSSSPVHSPPQSPQYIPSYSSHSPTFQYVDVPAEPQQLEPLDLNSSSLASDITELFAYLNASKAE